MGFLSPWFLVGLFGVGVPVFIHLLRKHVTIPHPVSSLMFFERGIQSSTRHRRLRYLLLFTLRLLLVTLIVLAFANPFLRRPVNANQILLVIALDSSFSMRAENRFAEAKRQALQLLSSKPRSRRAQIVSLGGHIQLLTEATADPNQLRAALDGITSGDGHANFSDLARSIRTLSESRSEPIEIHLFSDMQRTAMPGNFTEVALPAPVNLILHDISKKRAVANWAIESVSAPRDVTDPKDPAQSKVKAVVAGFATTETEKTISLIVSGKQVAARTIKVPPNGRTVVEFAPHELNYGFNRCEIQIEQNDPLPEDNVARFVIRRVDPQRVLFIHNASDQRSPTYFGTALNAATHGAFILQPMVAEQATNIDPARFAFTVLSDATALPTIFEHALEQYVMNGGSVLISLGLDAERQSHIPLWQGSLQRPHNFGVSNAATIGQVDFTFPALEQNHPSRDNGGWGTTKVIYAASVEASGARVAAKLNDGTPLLLEKQIGEGHVLLFTSGLDNFTNDLPLSPVFVVFVDKTARYLSGNEHVQGSQVVDSFVQLRSSTEGLKENPKKANAVEVLDPDGHRPLSLSDARSSQTFRLARTGFYQIHFANGREAVIGVNPDPKESDLTPISPEMQSLWMAGNKDQRKVAEHVTADKKYRTLSLWWYAMLLAFVVAVAERILSSRHLETQREAI